MHPRISNTIVDVFALKSIVFGAFVVLIIFRRLRGSEFRFLRWSVFLGFWTFPVWMSLAWLLVRLNRANKAVEVAACLIAGWCMTLYLVHLIVLIAFFVGKRSSLNDTPEIEQTHFEEF